MYRGSDISCDKVCLLCQDLSNDDLVKGFGCIVGCCIVLFYDELQMIVLGEQFNLNVMIVVNKILLLGICICVINVCNGCLIVVWINDCGLYVVGCCVDLLCVLFVRIVDIGQGIVLIIYIIFG